MCVADGATESIFAREFANMLVEKFLGCDARQGTALSHIMQTVVGKASAAWRQLMLTRTMPWYVQLKADEGAHAAFTAVRLIPAVAQRQRKRLFFQKTLYTCEAVAVGDVCVFVIRGDELIHAFPIDNPAEFNNSPRLISSLHDVPQRHIETTSAELQRGDTMFVLSDALAEWFLKSREGGLFPWKRLIKIKDKAAFDLLIEQLRAQRLMKNDDATALMLTLP
ncbi:MAG: SpoIIE family protein phosphatase [Nitrospirae bacterium]|nr:SpoIIE family protein phosphatase [Nitrospirota bacterium]